MTKTTDSPRWCNTCNDYGDHHTDRHESMTPKPKFTEGQPVRYGSSDDAESMGKILRVIPTYEYEVQWDNEDTDVHEERELYEL